MFKFKIGQVVSHVDHSDLKGVIVDRGYLGQIEQMDVDFDLSKRFEDDDKTFIGSSRIVNGVEEVVDEKNQYYQRWYRILWIGQQSNVSQTPTRVYNGQESEGVLELLQ